MASWIGAGIFSIFVTWPERERLTRNKDWLVAWGEMMRRPLGSMVMQIHEPWPISDECSSSTLNPGNTVRDSAAVALATFRTSPHGWSPYLPRLIALGQEASSNS